MVNYPYVYMTYIYLRNDLYCVEWDVKLYYTVQHMTYIVPPHAGLGGGILWRLPAYSCVFCYILYDALAE